MEIQPLDSKKYQLNERDIKKWLHNTGVFLAPAALVYLMILKNGGTHTEAQVALQLWILNTTIDLLKKYIKDNN